MGRVNRKFISYWDLNSMHLRDCLTLKYTQSLQKILVLQFEKNTVIRYEWPDMQAMASGKASRDMRDEGSTIFQFHESPPQKAA